MKKITVILLASAAVILSACKNHNQKAAGVQTEVNPEAEAARQVLKVELQNLVASAKKLNPAPFAEAGKNGTFSLTEKEKMVKPDYLLAPESVNDLLTLSQKYRAVAMLGIDLEIAQLYEMPAEDMKAAAGKLVLDINDDALTEFSKSNLGDTEAIKAAVGILVEAENDGDRANFFWEAVAASLVEQVYIITRDIYKFIPLFTDESASEFTYNFVCVHEALKSLIAYYPEMESLNAILEPIYVINAITVDEFRGQLMSVKADIENARAQLLK